MTQSAPPPAGRSCFLGSARGPCALVAARPERSRRSAIAIAALWRHPGGAQTDLQIDQRSSLGRANASRRRSETSRRCANASRCRQIESQRGWEGSPNGLIASRVAGTGLGIAGTMLGVAGRSLGSAGTHLRIARMSLGGQIPHGQNAL